MAERALSDLRVLEFADHVSGPFCGKLMADLGADVIKIELPRGDLSRRSGPFPDDVPNPERSGLFLYLNTNKRSVTVDPATPAGAETFRELVRTADVLIENQLPGTMAALGLDYESLERINPRLVVTSVTAFGQTGPYAKWKGNDLVCTNMSGLAYHTPAGGVAGPDIPPLKPGGRQSDFIAGSTAASATMFAAIAARAHGQGQHVDVSQQEAIASFLRHQVAFYTYDPEGLGFLRQLDRGARVWPVPMRPLPCRDGEVFARFRQEAQWRALVRLVAGDGWEQDARLQGMFEGDFNILTFLAQWGTTIRPLAEDWSKQHTRAEALALGEENGVPFSTSSYAGFGFLPCKDGYVVCGCRESYQWRDFVQLVIGDEWAADDRYNALLGDDFDLGAFLMEAGGTLWPMIVKWASTRTREEITIATQARSVPIVPCNTMEDVFESPHFAERRFLVDVDHPETGSLEYPGAPYDLSGTPWRIDRPAPLLGQHNDEVLAESRAGNRSAADGSGADVTGKLPLEGIRVCDLTWAVVGPIATQMLAVMGAEVIKIESSVHTDINRRSGPYFNGEADIEKTGNFQRVNLSKKSCTLDLTKPEAVEIARKLVAESDIVVSNFRTGVMDRFGLDDDALMALKPDLIIVASTSMGSTGPMKDYVGYNEEAYAYGGLGHVTGFRDAPPGLIAGDFADYLSGTLEAFAILAALHHRNNTGKGQVIEVSMAECAATQVPEEIMDYSMNRRVRDRIGNRLRGAAPHNCFPCEGNDEWVAIAVTSEEEWTAFKEALGHPGWAEDDRFASAESRCRNEDELEALVAEWTRNRSPNEATKLLQAAGVPSGPSVSIRELVADPHLAERGYFVAPEHPVVGERVLEGMPWKLSAVDVQISHAPMLGEDNYYVLSDLLEISDDEIARLMADGVIN